MPLIVDGNNVLGTRNVSEQQIVRELSLLSEAKKLKINLFFDGERDHGMRRQSHGRLQIYYSGRFSSADSQILAFIARIKDKNTWALVSDDHDLARQARDLGIKTQKTNTLWEMLAAFSAQQKQASSDDKPIYEGEKEDLLKRMMRNGS